MPRRFPPPWIVVRIPGGFNEAENGRLRMSTRGAASPRNAAIQKLASKKAPREAGLFEAAIGL